MKELIGGLKMYSYNNFKSLPTKMGHFPRRLNETGSVGRPGTMVRLEIAAKQAYRHRVQTLPSLPTLPIFLSKIEDKKL